MEGGGGEMSRHGLVEDGDNMWNHIRFRGAVAQATRGRRGQAFLKEMLEALDALPEKKLIRGDLATPAGEYCAMGCLMSKRGMDTNEFDIDDYEAIAWAVGVANALVQKIEYINDDRRTKTDEQRFQEIREWVVSAILPEKEANEIL
jgi:hypothetical protein